MGCLFFKSKKTQEDRGTEIVSKEYSWDKKTNINPNDYAVYGATSTDIWKLPGSVNGQQFLIQNCKNSSIYILDNMDTIAIDECIGCQIILGPVKGSLFVRDCQDCVCVGACGQFRMRDCHKMDVVICCATQPIIESSSSIRFACYQLHYIGLQDQMKAAGLSPFNNNWSSVHDFTPSSNWATVPASLRIQNLVHDFPAAQSESLKLSVAQEKSVVPLTSGLGITRDDSSQTCLVVFLFSLQQYNRARAFINMLAVDRPDCLLITTKEVSLSAQEAESIFLSKYHESDVEAGPVVGLFYRGDRIIHSCYKVVDDMTLTSRQVYISSNANDSKQQSHTFLSIANLHMAVN